MGNEIRTWQILFLVLNSQMKTLLRTLNTNIYKGPELDC